jgi:peptidoglycan/LPS O-acetylase OafA/YrhL
MPRAAAPTLLVLAVLAIPATAGGAAGLPARSNVFCPGIPLILVQTIAPSRWMSAAREWRPIVVVGRMSYSLYLWHQPVGSFLFVERPMLKLKHRFSGKRAA